MAQSNFLSILFCLFFYLPCFAEQGEAAHSIFYSVNPQPNYLNYSDLEIRKNLSDGVYADSPMWSSRYALAWKDVRKVSITLDLGAPTPVSEIVFNGGARLSAGVEFPYNAFIYLSLDGAVFEYAGDSVGFAEPSSEAYENRRFNLKGVGKVARFVRFEFIVRGRYFAIDEIEIGRGDVGAPLVGGLQKSDISIDAEMRASNARDLFLKRRLSNELDRLKAPPGSDALQRRAILLSTRFRDRSFLLSDVEPWENSPVRILPKADVSQNTRRLIPEGGCEYRSFALTNTTQVEGSFQVSQIIEGSRMKAYLKEAKVVVAATLDTVVDPLVDVGESIVIVGGETKVFFLRICGPGTHTLVVDAFRQRVSASTYLEEVRLDGMVEPLRGVSWAYLDEPPMRGRQKAALADLRDHFIDVDVIPPSSLPDFDSDSFDQISKVLERSVGARHVLLFLNFRQKPPHIESSIWSQQFINWVARMAKAARQAGVDPQRLLLYPYDEPNLNEVVRAEAFYRWVRKSLPDVKLFATFDKVQVAERLLEFVDISAVTRAVAPKMRLNENVWLYDVKGPAKANAPYSYYMLLPWEAYVRGSGGAGFWSYADIYGSAWDDFDGKNPDYGVVYQGFRSDEVVGSRRWEAWRRGMEDIRILRNHARRYGDAVTTRLVTNVLALSGDPRQADFMRQKMLSDLKRPH